MSSLSSKFKQQVQDLAFDHTAFNKDRWSLANERDVATLAQNLNKDLYGLFAQESTLSQDEKMQVILSCIEVLAAAKNFENMRVVSGLVDGLDYHIDQEAVADIFSAFDPQWHAGLEYASAQM